MVVVNGTVSGNGISTISGYVTVNGVALQPGLVAQKCAGSCSLSGTWFMDVDTAELANPGLFYYSLSNKNPLTVQFVAGANGGNIGSVALVASIVKK